MAGKKKIATPTASPTKVLVATSLAPGKEYCLEFNTKVIHSLQGVSDVVTVFDCYAEHVEFSKCERNGVGLDILKLPPYDGPSEPPDSYYARCARVREAARQYFLAGDYTHLFFLDADTIPPVDAIPRLLAHNAPIASGIYLRRGAMTPVLASMPTGSDLERLPVQAGEHQVFSCAGFGMGCMLIAREVLEKTA